MKKGFTLMELLIYSAIIALIIVFTVLFVLSIVKETAKSSVREEVQRNAANILRVFTFEVREAQSIYTSTSDFSGNPGRLSLLITRNLPAGETSSYIDMYTDDGAFCVKRELTGVSCITSSGVDVTSLAFTRIVQAGGQESVRMRFILRYDHPNAEFQFPATVQTSARLRSY